MRKFNLKEAKAGKPVCTRNGCKVRILCTDMNSNMPIVAIITSQNGDEEVGTFCLNGDYTSNGDEHDLDLMIEEDLVYGWQNVYRRGDSYYSPAIYSTKERALTAVQQDKGYVRTERVQIKRKENKNA